MSEHEPTDRDYLYDRSGEVDPEIERLERVLGTLRYRPSPPRRSRARGRTIAVVVAAAVVAAAAAAALLLLLGRHRGGDTNARREAPPQEIVPVGAPVAVTRLEGAPLCGDRPLGEHGLLQPGEWLATDDGSRAEIALATIGKVEVQPASRVRVVESTADRQHLELERGEIHARVSAPPRLFLVDTPSATAVDLGCAYTLRVDDQGGTQLRVTSGWVALEGNGRSSLVPAGAACHTRRGAGPGTPYYEDAPPALIAALERLDFADDGAPALQIVLDQARNRDALTLWHLLFRVDGAARGRVYARLAVLSPPPTGITQDDAVKLKREKLDLWKNDLVGRRP